jgi:hypothetical protein
MLLRRRHFVVLGVAAFGLGARAAIAAPASSFFGGDLQNSVETAPDWNISGTLQALNGQFWDVQGFTFRVNANTKVSGDTPSIGDFVSAEGVVLPDGSWLATAVRLRRANTPTATSTSTPVSSTTNTPTQTPTNSPTNQTPTNTPTNTPTATPTEVEETATSVATRAPGVTRTPRPGEGGDDRQDDASEKREKQEDRDQRADKRHNGKRKSDRDDQQGNDQQGNGSDGEGDD